MLEGQASVMNERQFPPYLSCPQQGVLLIIFIAGVNDRTGEAALLCLRADVTRESGSPGSVCLELCKHRDTDCLSMCLNNCPVF